MGSILVYDVNSEAWRAAHATGMLNGSDDGHPIGILFRILQDLPRFMDRFQAFRAVFCFDVGWVKRKDLLPEYKSKRAALTPEDAEAYSKVREQIDELRLDVLPELGFANVLWAEGYEADDVIASFVQQTLDPLDDAVIVSCDKDLWQLLGQNVTVYNSRTKEVLDDVGFTNRWGVLPSMWSDVKAIAGCGTDEVPGVKGVAELTAVKFLKRVLPPSHKTFQAIVKAQCDGTIRRNVQLVRLPYAGCPRFELKKDNVTKASWKGTMKRLGLDSLADSYPLCCKG